MVDNRIVVGSLALLMAAAAMSLMYFLNIREIETRVIESNPVESKLITGTDFTAGKQVAN